MTQTTETAFDAWLERLGDRINPILVKETRQALKSRQFSVTFLLLLVASLVVSFALVAIAGPDLDYRSAGAGFFVAYFAVLAFAVFVVVPFGAYRSLATEQEERTFELIAISTLRPRQIVAGKLLSAIIQMFMYYSAIAPFMAFTVLLKGIDVPSILIVLFFSVLASLGLSMVALLLATLARRRGWQAFLSVLIIAGLLFATVISFFAAWSIVTFIGPELRQTYFWIGLATFLTVYGSYFWLAFRLSAAQLTFEADNRSSPVRAVLVIQTLACLAWIAYWWIAEGDGDYDSLLSVVTLVCMHWLVVGSLLIGESPGLSRRVARQVPAYALGRAVTTLFLPGPGTGLAFLMANLMSILAMVGVAEMAEAFGAPTATPRTTRGPQYPTLFVVALVSYVFLYVASGGLVVQAIRRWRSVPALAGAAIVWLLAAVGILVPTFFALVLPSHRYQDYRVWQITDPIATLIEVYKMPSFGSLALLPVGMAMLLFLLNLRSMAHAVEEIETAGRHVAQAPRPTLSSGDAGSVRAAAEPAGGI
jgi:hypothetical protein